MGDILTWLHLSDLHMRRESLDDLRVVLDVLWRDIPEQISKAGGKLDFIAFTGDIAHAGKEEEYKLAEEHFFQPLLEITGLTTERLFVVPGNHDVDWDLIKLINPNMPSSLSNRDKVNALLRSEDQRHFLLGPMTRYSQFVQRYFGPSPDHKILRDPPYYYAQSIPWGSQSIALIGLNSAWFSGFTMDARGEVADRGNLLIGEEQIRGAMKEAEGATAQVALVHHPPSWLKEFDEWDTERVLRAGCDFVLLGHTHWPEFKQEKALGGETITVPAGTIYYSRDWLNGYNVVQLDMGTGRGKIILRRYSQERCEWVRDTQSTGDTLNGVVEFDLPGRLGQSGGQRYDDLWSKIRPSWSRLGREREIQLVESFLQQNKRHTLWIWGEENCGLKEFIQLIIVFLQHKDFDVICFDAEDVEFGVAVDQHYFLSKLEHWSGSSSEISFDQNATNLDDRLQRSLVDIKHCLSTADRRLALVFANIHLMIPSVREWAVGAFWKQILETLKGYKPLGIFACEGSVPACPARAQESRIYLGEFTVKDVEQFLHTLSTLDPHRIPELARKIHAQGDDRLLASPRCVYKNLIYELNRPESAGGTGERTF